MAQDTQRWHLSRGFRLLQCTLGNSLSVATVLCYLRVGRAAALLCVPKLLVTELTPCGQK